MRSYEDRPQYPTPADPASKPEVSRRWGPEPEHVQGDPLRRLRTQQREASLNALTGGESWSDVTRVFQDKHQA